MVTSTIELQACPSCGGDCRLPMFPPSNEPDNDLAAAVAKDPQREVGGIKLSDLKRSEWSICARCGLMHSTKRPNSATLKDWYPALFKEVENRAYDSDPLPDIYMRNQAEFAKELFGLLDSAGVFTGAQNALHLRCNAGFLLEQVVKNTGIRDVYGLEYFSHPAARAGSIAGADHVKLIDTPEPKNPFPPKVFDVLLVEHFLTHAFNLRQYTDYLKSLMSPNGVAVFFNEIDHRLSLRPGHQYSKGVNFFHNQLFTQQTLTDFLQSAGFEVQLLPHPRARKWAVAEGAVLAIARKGPVKAVPPRPEEVRQSLIQSHSWLEAKKARDTAGPFGKAVNNLRMYVRRKRRG